MPVMSECSVGELCSARLLGPHGLRTAKNPEIKRWIRWPEPVQPQRLQSGGLGQTFSARPSVAPKDLRWRFNDLTAINKWRSEAVTRPSQGGGHHAIPRHLSEY